MKGKTMDFHAHVYYDWGHRDEALQLHAELEAICPQGMTIYPLVDRLVGPHLLPMFEIDFAGRLYDALTGWLEQHHGNLPVLIHPLTPDEIANHGELARWIGEEQPINWARLGVAA
ncbi:MAG TPA: DOPA 4,5-dioxygenase family protein [Candidatus Obscuribacterales bacterium]